MKNRNIFELQHKFKLGIHQIISGQPQFSLVKFT
jgi:hypothetical protein